MCGSREDERGREGSSLLLMEGLVPYFWCTLVAFQGAMGLLPSWLCKKITAGKSFDLSGLGDVLKHWIFGGFYRVLWLVFYNAFRFQVVLAGFLNLSRSLCLCSDLISFLSWLSSTWVFLSLALLFWLILRVLFLNNRSSIFLKPVDSCSFSILAPFSFKERLGLSFHFVLSCSLFI